MSNVIAVSAVNVFTGIGSIFTTSKLGASAATETEIFSSLQQPNSVDSHPPRMGDGISTGKPMADVRRKSAEKAKKVFLTIADMMTGGMLIYLPII
jgi:hypothetical protein